MSQNSAEEVLESSAESNDGVSEFGYDFSEISSQEIESSSLDTSDDSSISSCSSDSIYSHSSYSDSSASSDKMIK